MSRRASAMICRNRLVAPGKGESHRRGSRATSSIESARIAADERRLHSLAAPSMPSEIDTVLNPIGVPPAWRILLQCRPACAVEIARPISIPGVPTPGIGLRRPGGGKQRLSASRARAHVSGRRVAPLRGFNDCLTSALLFPEVYEPSVRIDFANSPDERAGAVHCHILRGTAMSA